MAVVAVAAVAAAPVVVAVVAAVAAAAMHLESFGEFFFSSFLFTNLYYRYITSAPPPALGSLSRSSSNYKTPAAMAAGVSRRNTSSSPCFFSFFW